MWLTDAWIHGLRRFGGEQRHRVRFDGKLICLIGANEAGKSTVLDALEIAHTTRDFTQSDRTRGEQLPADREVVHLRYRIDAERILLLADDVDLEIEDLIVPDVYVRAVQLSARDVGGTHAFGVADLPSESCRRHEAVEAWRGERNLRAPSKIAIANKLIDQVGEGRLLDEQHADRVRDLHTRVRDLLAEPTDEAPGDSASQTGPENDDREQARGT
jgi:AAA domain